MPVTAIYTTKATATGGGRDGKTALEDGTLSLQLAVPKEMGGPGGDAPNPEKLFALGYAACYRGAMGVAAQQTGIKIPAGTTVTAEIGVGPRSEGGFGITAALDVYLPGMPEAEAHKLTEVTHTICPYSNAMRGNVDFKTTTRA